MEESFSIILNKDEKIIECFKPKKSKMILSVFLGVVLIVAAIVGMSMLARFVPDEQTGEVMPLWLFIALLAASGGALVLSLVLISVAYNKRVYCITDQRVIIRCGVIGADFRSLELKSIGAVDVSVGLLDKILRMNTGTIKFGSMSAPINGNVIYAFSHIVDPYGTYKRLKEIIESI